MTPTIKQTVRFSCAPEVLFEMYMDSAKHSEATGMRARINRKPGGAFTAFEGALWGKNLLIIPNRLIVQAWRSTNFNKSDPDSILILEFRKAAGGSEIEMVHVNVPSQDHKGVTKGWPKYYWKPWKAYLAKRKRKD